MSKTRVEVYVLDGDVCESCDEKINFKVVGGVKYGSCGCKDKALHQYFTDENGNQYKYPIRVSLA